MAGQSGAPWGGALWGILSIITPNPNNDNGLRVMTGQCPTITPKHSNHNALRVMISGPL